MSWNWELPNWLKFIYEPSCLTQKEKQFLLGVGGSFAFLNSVKEEDRERFILEILSVEGMESSKIEGEFLDGDSLQSSIRKHFGITTNGKRGKKESQMAMLLCDVYQSFNEPLSHEMLCRWHFNLFEPGSGDCGKYRSHTEPMQIVFGRYGSSRVFFEAPPSEKIPKEMEAFIHWFNATSIMPCLEKAALAHLYFESIHPFEDGNGRIGRLLVEKVLSQEAKRPILIAISKVLEKRKKEYYDALERCNRTLEIDHWMGFFADAILQAQEESMDLLWFLIEKSKMFIAFLGKLNEREEKVLLRMFAEGPSGFKGGLSADNYISITKTSRATATRDLTDLVQKGALIKTGELRHTRYTLNLSKKP